VNMTLNDPNPRITRVLPALAAETHPVWPETRSSRSRFSIWLQGRETLQVWDDRVIASGHSYSLDQDFGVRIAADPRAPLTVDPPLGLALLALSGHWDVYIPADEADIWPTVFAIHQACRERGVEPIGLADEGNFAQEWGGPAQSQVPQPLAQTSVIPQAILGTRDTGWSAAIPWATGAADDPITGDDGRALQFTQSEAVLVAIAHLSLLFLPVLLPAAIWLSLRFAAPRVARQARRAVIFQCGASALALGTLGYSFIATLAGGFNLAARFGLVGFFVLMAAAAGSAFVAAVQVLRGQDFGTFGLA
jgi:uncharacterized Tic20 family protein